MQCGLPSFTMQNFKLRFYRKQTITDNCVFFLKRTAGSTTLYDVICWKLLMDEMDWWRSFHRNKIKETEKQNQFYWINKRWRKKKISHTFSYFVFCLFPLVGYYCANWSISLSLCCSFVSFFLFPIYPVDVFCSFFSLSLPCQYTIYMYRWCVGKGSSFLYMSALYLYSHKVRHDNSALFREQTAKAHQQGRIKRAKRRKKRRLCVRVYFVWRWPNKANGY